MKDLDYMAQSDDERVQNMQDVDKLAELLSATRWYHLGTFWCRVTFYCWFRDHIFFSSYG